MNSVDSPRLSAPGEPSARHRIVRRGALLVGVTLGYNVLEGVIATIAGVLAGSVALVGFGGDSLIEVTAGLVAAWRLRRDADPIARETSERRARRVIGVTFMALAIFVTIDAARTIVTRETPERSVVGLAIAGLSLVIMPVLAHEKRKVARALDSEALHAESRQTDICWILSLILLAGLGLNIAFGWWWADPVAAIGMAPLIAREGWLTFRGQAACADCAPIPP